MSFSRLRLIVVASWVASLFVVIGVGLAFGLVTSMRNGGLLILLGSLPAMLFLAVFRGAPPRTIAQVLYDSEQSAPTPGARRYATVTPPETK